MDVASALEPGDLVTLSGRSRRRQDRVRPRWHPLPRRRRALEVPSPTFTLVQTYELPRFRGRARRSLPASRQRASLPSSASTICPEGAVVLLEWPDRAAGFLPPDRLDIAFTLAPQPGADHRNVRVTGYGTLRAARRAHSRQVAHVPRSNGASATRIASACRATPRRATYERLLLDDQRTHPDERAAPAGRAAGTRRQALQRHRASRRGHQAVSSPMAAGLRDHGLSAPTDPARRPRRRDLLHHRRISARIPSSTAIRRRRSSVRYRPPSIVLASLASASRCRRCCASRPTSTTACRTTTSDAFLIEAELLLDWYLPQRDRLP